MSGWFRPGAPSWWLSDKKKDKQMNVQKHMELLGLPCRDKVTGFQGVVSSISFDLYGCVQAVVTPGAEDGTKLGDSHWFDIARIEVTHNEPVMRVPDFSQGYIAEGKKGSADKPLSGRRG